MNTSLSTEKVQKFSHHQYEKKHMVSYIILKVKINWMLLKSTISNTEIRDSCKCSERH